MHQHAPLMHTWPSGQGVSQLDVPPSEDESEDESEGEPLVVLPSIGAGAVELESDTSPPTDVVVVVAAPESSPPGKAAPSSTVQATSRAWAAPSARKTRAAPLDEGSSRRGPRLDGLVMIIHEVARLVRYDDRE